MEALPQNLLSDICLFLDAKSVCRLSCVSKFIHQSIRANAPLIFQRLCYFLLQIDCNLPEGPATLLVNDPEIKQGDWLALFKSLIATNFLPFELRNSGTLLEISNKNELQVNSMTRKNFNRIAAAWPSFKRGNWVATVVGKSKLQLIILRPNIFYFEVSLVERESKHLIDEFKTTITPCIAVGLVEPGSDFNLMPGWSSNTVGYHSDDGKLFHQHVKQNGRKFGKRFGIGDTVGCAWNSVNGRVLFTLNGKVLPVVEKVFDDDLFELCPAIGIDNFLIKCVVNFGNNPFVASLSQVISAFKEIITSADEQTSGDEVFSMEKKKQKKIK